MNSIKVYVYDDADHGDVEVFSSLRKAKAYADKCWPGDMDESWDRQGNCWTRGEYESIRLRVVDSEQER